MKSRPARLPSAVRAHLVVRRRSRLGCGLMPEHTTRVAYIQRNIHAIVLQNKPRSARSRIGLVAMSEQTKVAMNDLTYEWLKETYPDTKSDPERVRMAINDARNAPDERTGARALVEGHGE